MKPKISLVILDLDNTIYDWLQAFVPAFYKMVDAAIPILNVGKERLLDELQAVHRKHHDSEHPFSLLETDTVVQKFGNLTRSEQLRILDPAFHAFNIERKENLTLYEGVAIALKRMCSFGVPVVAYTDARVSNCLFRIQKLGVTDYLAHLYAPEHRNLKVDQKRIDSDFVHMLHPDDKKPNPQALLEICAEYEIEPMNAVYVGDSLVRDVYMAKKAGLWSAWAKYGTIYNKDLWPLLVRVTHWTEEDVERETALRSEAEGVEPDHVLDRFDDLLEHFDFDRDGAQVTCGSGQ